MPRHMAPPTGDLRPCGSAPLSRTVQRMTLLLIRDLIAIGLMSTLVLTTFGVLRLTRRR
jgi:hypothetical protein